MIVHRDRFLVNKTNRRTEFQFYLLVIITLHVSGSLSAHHQELSTAFPWCFYIDVYLLPVWHR